MRNVKDVDWSGAISSFCWISFLAWLALFLILGSGCACPHERWTADVRDLPSEHTSRWPGVSLPTQRCAVYTCVECGERVGIFAYEHPWNGPPWGMTRGAEGD